MASQKMIDLVRALSVGTENRQLIWEDLPDEEMFRTHVFGGLIRVGRTEDKRGYALWLMGGDGVLVAESSFLPGEAGYEQLEELYAAARLRARGGDVLLDSIINHLNPARRERVTRPTSARCRCGECGRPAAPPRPAART